MSSTHVASAFTLTELLIAVHTRSRTHGMTVSEVRLRFACLSHPATVDLHEPEHETIAGLEFICQPGRDE
jgi:hypothetical protein